MVKRALSSIFQHLMPHIDDPIDKIHGANFFSKIDFYSL
jgi:hypothetical protein